MITRLQEFEIYLILESFIEVAPDLRKALYNVNHPIAEKILGLIDPETNLLTTEEDVKDAEAIYTAPVADQIVIQKHGQNINPNNVMKIGKFVRKISSEFTPNDIESFVKAYKSSALQVHLKPEIVKGDKIREVFLDVNILSKTGDYATNCMMSGNCQPYLEVYVDNPKRISAAVQKNEDGKIVARALLWNTDQGEVVMDRVYSTDANWKAAMEKWGVDQGYYRRAFDDGKPRNADKFIFKNSLVERKFTVTLTSYEYPFWPYLDTFSWMTTEGVLSNYIPAGADFYEFKKSNGTYVLIENNWWNDRPAMNKSEVIELLEEFKIFEYEIHADLSVTVNQNLNIIYERIVKLPITFKDIYGDVVLVECSLESLEGLPKIIRGTLDVSGNPNLYQLIGGPEIINGDFIATGCALRNLVGGPKQVKGEYDVRENELRNLDGLANKISGSLNLSRQNSNTRFKISDIQKLSSVKGKIYL